MDLKTYIDIILRRKWVVLITVVVTVAVVAFGTWRMTPTYKAIATLRIATASASSTSLDYQFADRLINTYIIVATSQPLLDELNKQLGLSRPLQISVEAIANTELITISVEDYDPNLAVTAANTLGDILIAQGSEYYSGSGNSPSETLKVQVDQAESDLNQVRLNYFQLLAKNQPDQADLVAIGKEVDLKQQIYNTLLSQYAQLRAKEAVQANMISVVSPASFPETPSKPNKLLYLGIGLVVSLISGFGLVLIVENLDTTLFSAATILAVAQLPMLGRIPEERKKKNRQVQMMENTYYAEAYLRLRTNLLKIKTIEDSSCKTLLITSALQGEGKSTIISNLAYLLTQTGKRVILVEADLRHSSLHKIFELPNQLGLSDYLLGKADLDEIIQPTLYPGLSVITKGQSTTTTEPVNLLSSSRMQALLQELFFLRDLILIDTPSVLAVTDTSVIAPLVDGVLLVVKRAFVGKEKLEAAIEQLASVKANLIGLIINNEKINHNLYEYRSYSVRKEEII
jgi:succinoglycan biosynthesis transport protein ExoP